MNDDEEMSVLDLGAVAKRNPFGMSRFAPARRAPARAAARAPARTVSRGAAPSRHRKQPLAFTTVTFGAATGTSLQTTTQPQRAFKGRRLIVVVGRDGATATGLVTLSQLTIGVANQFVSTGGVPAEAFAPDANESAIDLDTAPTSLNITLVYGISAAPTTTDTVSVGTTILGETVG